MNSSTTPSLRAILFSEIFLRKLLWLVILTMLATVAIIIVPRAATLAPAIDSKLLALRTLLGVTLLLAGANWRSLLRPRWQFIDTIFAGLTLSFLASLLFSGKALYGLSEFWHLGALPLVAWIVIRLRPSVSECYTVARIGGMLGFLAALYGFLTYIGMDVLKSLYPFDYSKAEGGRNLIHSFYGNPEYFGGFAAPTAALLFGLGLRPRLANRWRLLWIASSVFVLSVLFISGSRGALLGFLVGGAIAFFGQIRLMPPAIRRISWMVVGFGLIVAAMAVVVLSTPNPLNRRDMRLAQRFQSIIDTRSASTRERILFYTSTAMAIPKHPVFGFGPGTYRLEFFNNVKMLVDQDPRAGTTVLLNELNRRLAEHTHNDYLEIWFEQGTVGIGLFLLLITHGGVRFVVTRYKGRYVTGDSPAADGVSLVVIFSAAASTIVINCLTSFPLHMPARATLLWILVGTFFAADQITSQLLAPPGASTDRDKL